MSQWNVVLHMASGKSHELSYSDLKNTERFFESIRRDVFGKDHPPVNSIGCTTAAGGKVVFHPRDVQSITLEEASDV